MVVFGIHDDLPTISATGKLSPHDYETIEQEVAKLAETKVPLRLLIVLDGFEGWEPPALSRDLDLSLRLRHQIERIAVVHPDASDEVRVGSILTQPLFGEHVRVFPAGEIDAARSWLLEG